MMSLIIRFLFDRELYKRTAPSSRCRAVGRLPKKQQSNSRLVPDTRQLQLFIEVSPGRFVPAFKPSSGPKRPGRVPKVRLKKTAKPTKPPSKKLARVEALAGKPFDSLTPAQQAEVEAHFRKQIEERSREVRRTWTPEQEAEHNQIPAIPVDYSPVEIHRD